MLWMLQVLLLAPLQAPPPGVPADGKLVVLTDTTGTQVTIDGELQGVAPVSLVLQPGAHSVTFTAPGMPPFHVEVEVFETGRTEVSARVAQHRLPADFARKKADYDDAMFSVGWKALGGVCGCGLGAVALGVAGALALVPATASTVLPVATAIGGGVGCLGGSGLCGWGILNVANSPDEPIIPRVHIVKITPPSGARDAKVLEFEAPPVDSDGDPIDEDKKDDAPPLKDGQGDNGIIEASVRY